jgi:hypothetical protein
MVVNTGADSDAHLAEGRSCHNGADCAEWGPGWQGCAQGLYCLLHHVACGGVAREVNGSSEIGPVIQEFGEV